MGDSGEHEPQPGAGPQTSGIERDGSILAGNEPDSRARKTNADVEAETADYPKGGAGAEVVSPGVILEDPAFGSESNDAVIGIDLGVEELPQHLRSCEK
jgi:hypothetical protein